MWIQEMCGTLTQKCTLVLRSILPSFWIEFFRESSEIQFTTSIKNRGRISALAHTRITPALKNLRAGANLLQVYTGLVYQGPGLLHAINRGLVQTLAHCGACSLAELVAV